MNVNQNNTKVGFIGLGIMGRSMAGRLQREGYKLHVYNRTKSKAEELLAGRAQWHDSPGEVAANADVIFAMVGYPSDVEEIFLGSGAIVDSARKGAILVDMTTSKPSLAVKIAETAKARGMHALDAPVSGGEGGAINGTLSIMVGGEQAPFDAVKPLFEIMGENIRLQGGPGAGQHTKMCNQIVIAGNMLATAEGLTYARKSGLDPKQVLKSIGTGAASSFLLNAFGPKMIDGDFTPNFFVHHFIKDMTIAIKEADAMGADLPGLRTAKSLYDKIAAEGAREEGTQALIKAYK